MIRNPILPGFYPDPSICRVADDFYLVTSSFSYFPGVPIFHSKDLEQWEQIGHVLDRPEQLPLTHEMISAGIFAPTIRHHDGTFYMITTNMSMGVVNFIVTADDPAGPWSEMRIIEGADGIDPSLFWDDDGKCYYTGTTRFDDESGSKQGIWCSEIDLANFQLVGDRHIIGTGAQVNAEAPEGPHLYKKDGYYYLLIAEGGTEHFHAVTISRSRSIFGEYENHQGNPILTHRHLGKGFPIWNVGHGDLVELANGDWYMVCLGSRLAEGQHKLLGRETFLVPVVWEDGWPVVSKGTGKVEWTYPSPGLPSWQPQTRAVNDFSKPVVENFGNGLGFEWNFLGTPREDFAKVEDGCLHLKLLKNATVPWEFDNTDGSVFSRIAKVGKTKENVSFVGRRQQHLDFRAKVTVRFSPDENETAGIVILQNDANQLRLEITKGPAGAPLVRCVRVISHYDQAGIQHFSETVVGEIAAAPDQAEFVLQAQGNGARYSFYGGPKADHLDPVAESVDGSFLGSETAGGFVGAYIGLVASGNGQTKEKYATFDTFIYEGYEREGENQG